MTREERDKAIDIFEHNWTQLVNGDYTEEELNMAISKALEALRAEPCEDVVSREHLLSEIEALKQTPWFNNGRDDDRFTHYGYVERKEAVEIVRDLCVKIEPPVTPARKTGKWIVHDIYYQIRCMQCGHISPMHYKWDFCPRCGAEMREGDEE